MKKMIFILLALMMLSVACTNKNNEQPLVEDNLPTVAQLCEQNSGTWIESAQECEGISKESCENLGGQFNECASACRNNPDAVVCTLQCVLVCEFAPEQSDVVEEFMIGPELRDCVGVGPQQCMMVNDQMFYDTIEGFTYEEGYEYVLKVTKTQRENVPADANKYMYSLVEVVSKTKVIPKDCVSWFDGCNTCMVSNGEIRGCTKKYCQEMQESYCLEFE